MPVAYSTGTSRTIELDFNQYRARVCVCVVYLEFELIVSNMVLNLTVLSLR